MTRTKLIFGLHTQWEAVTLAFTAKADSPAPDITIVKRDATTPRVVPYDADLPGWRAKLEAGDYLITMTVPADRAWFEDDVRIDVVDQPGVAFVFHGPPTPASAHVTRAWSAASTSTSMSPVGGDPKDPWPPPFRKDPWPLPEDTTFTLPPDSFAWHETTLHEARAALPILRSFAFPDAAVAGH